ncbi:DEAD/DEAH box helicase [Phreatobacter oligotrophus]|uniref:DEAD-box ATP-dependent RNA helicase RhpA n=1 Tax=Phreatobacter oligotrophus TaxID=1122261 RepID=A0A2T4ZHI6_9HYPH|nr:DEAD/DEAH box helicase [Phreatobacter oligotrophus]MBX9991475.1 DEAD/DEAH box helicase [Phreatobacter oligotrophus]PTM61435.1 ATP-dependent RNA helicase RhlE [Phreatobacter oligotrophus]
MNNSSFVDLGLAEPLLRSLRDAGYETPTPIQAKAIPHLLDDHDLIGIAQTGTGKTAAFSLPILQHLSEDRVPLPAKGVRALVLAPTRELALQIFDNVTRLSKHLKLRHAVIFGGVGQNPQAQAIARGIDVLVATPGRLIDLMGQGLVRLDTVTHLVLDEADRMLDMGFIRDVRKILAKLPEQRQSMLFSATMPAEVAKLARDMLWEPMRVEVTPEIVTVEAIEQHVFHVGTSDKRQLLEKLLGDPALARVVVFTRTKHGANRLAGQLVKSGFSADAIHGNKSQNARQRALAAFKSGECRILVATDLFARGIDVAEVTHVVNFDLPNEPESYVHRIGRTGRAGRTGIALAFCDPSERGHLAAIEKLTRVRLAVAASPIQASSPARTEIRPAARPARRPQPRPRAA